jgi:hypothetical protein
MIGRRLAAVRKMQVVEPRTQALDVALATLGRVRRPTLGDRLRH